MKQIHIGLLIPSSTILPIGKDYEKGLKEGLSNFPELEFEITKEFIGQGGQVKTEEAINKLITYDDVDIVTGVVSGMSAESMREKFKLAKKPFVVSNLGEQLPIYEHLNEYVFFNSYFLWQHAWALGYQGVKRFGKKGMFVGAVFDGGYSFSYMFHEGMKAADINSEWFFSIPPMPNKGELSDMNIIFPFIEKYQPDFIFAAFCGAETTLFLNRFIEEGWHKRTKLMGLPFLLEPFTALKDDLVCYSTLPTALNPNITAKQSFYHLGYRAGIGIAKAAVKAESWKQLQQQLEEDGTFFNINQLQQEKIIKHETHLPVLTKNSITANSEEIATEILEAIVTLSLKDPFFKQLDPTTQFGWINSYLAI